VYGRHEAASELAATDPEHGMMEEVLAKFGDEKGSGNRDQTLPGRKARPGPSAGTDFSGSFVLWVRVAEPEANVPVTVKA
jgi:hypothetical protein